MQPRTFGPEVIALMLRTRQSRIHVAQAARTRVFADDGPAADERELYQLEDYIRQVIAVDVRRGVPLRVEKMVALYTSHDRAISEPLGNAGKSVLDYAGLRRGPRRPPRGVGGAVGVVRHPPAGRLHRRCSCILRVHSLHLLQTVLPHTAELDAGVPARGLHGEAYRGHIFWDELFIFPVLNLRLPRSRRSLLRYRYRRLREARRAAAAAGYAGAMFPWQSGSDGREESHGCISIRARGGGTRTPAPRSTTSASAIAYNVWQYYQVTGDSPSSCSTTAPRCCSRSPASWSASATYDASSDRYEHPRRDRARRVPRRLPRRPVRRRRQQRLHQRDGGLGHHARDRRVSICCRARRRGRCCERLGLGSDELAQWDDVSRRMFVPFHGDGVISQFEG